MERCAYATTYGVLSIECLQDYFCSIGLTNFKNKTLGAKEFMLDFETTKEMESTILDARSFLEDHFEWVNPCHDIFVCSSHLM